MPRGAGRTLRANSWRAMILPAGSRICQAVCSRGRGGQQVARPLGKSESCKQLQHQPLNIGGKQQAARGAITAISSTASSAPTWMYSGRPRDSTYVHSLPPERVSCTHNGEAADEQQAPSQLSVAFATCSVQVRITAPTGGHRSTAGLAPLPSSQPTAQPPSHCTQASAPTQPPNHHTQAPAPTWMSRSRSCDQPRRWRTR